MAHISFTGKGKVQVRQYWSMNGVQAVSQSLNLLLYGHSYLYHVLDCIIHITCAIFRLVSAATKLKATSGGLAGLVTKISTHENYLVYCIGSIRTTNHGTMQKLLLTTSMDTSCSAILGQLVLAALPSLKCKRAWSREYAIILCTV